MEDNYKEFIAKIKYMTEYDTSKTRDENQVISESEELSEAANTDLELKKAGRDIFSIIKSKGFPVEMVTSSREFQSKDNKEDIFQIPIKMVIEDGKDGSGYITIAISQSALFNKVDKSVNELDVDHASMAAYHDKVDKAYPKMMNKLKELHDDIVSKLGNQYFEYRSDKKQNKGGDFIMQIRKKQ